MAVNGLNFRAYSARVWDKIRNASHAEIDAQYKAGVPFADAIDVIRKARRNAKIPRGRFADVSDFDYSMND